MLSTVEEESEADQTKISSRVETYTLTRITNAANNQGYGLEDIENIGAHPTKSADPQEEKPNNHRTFENKEYFNTLDSTDANKNLTRVPLKYADLLDIAQQVAVGMVTIIIIIRKMKNNSYLLFRSF